MEQYQNGFWGIADPSTTYAWRYSGFSELPNKSGLPMKSEEFLNEFPNSNQRPDRDHGEWIHPVRPCSFVPRLPLSL